MSRPAMTVLGDPTGRSQCLKHHDVDITACATPPCRSLRKTISLPSVSSIVKDSWNWAGETLGNYRDGMSAEQRKRQADIEDRKQVLYVKIKNVSNWKRATAKVSRLQSHLADLDLDCRRCRTRNGATAPWS